MDNLGNINAKEGYDPCARCGCKYWENDHCIDCNMSVERSKIVWHGRAFQFGNEIWLNVQLTNLSARLGFTEAVHNLDVVTTTEKYRAKGWIV